MVASSMSHHCRSTHPATPTLSGRSPRRPWRRPTWAPPTPCGTPSGCVWAAAARPHPHLHRPVSATGAP
jgi:hypothetical protein